MTHVSTDKSVVSPIGQSYTRDRNALYYRRVGFGRALVILRYAIMYRKRQNGYALIEKVTCLYYLHLHFSSLPLNRSYKIKSGSEVLFLSLARLLS